MVLVDYQTLSNDWPTCCHKGIHVYFALFQYPRVYLRNFIMHVGLKSS
jgi:hypothetical protein